MVSGKMTISLIIPFRNDFGNVSRLAACLKSQTLSADEYIFIDDASDFPLEEYHLNGLSNLKIFRNERRLGPASSRNSGSTRLKASADIYRL